MNKDRTLEIIKYFRRKSCCYDGLLFEKEPAMCDCKYGMNTQNPDRGGEQTGCPELRELEGFLSIVTQEEIDKIISKFQRKRDKRYKEMMDAMNDALVEVHYQQNKEFKKLTTLILHDIYAYIPKHIISIGDEWGYRDTEFRDKLYEYLLENSHIIDESIKKFEGWR